MEAVRCDVEQPDPSGHREHRDDRDDDEELALGERGHHRRAGRARVAHRREEEDGHEDRRAGPDDAADDVNHAQYQQCEAHGTLRSRESALDRGSDHAAAGAGAQGGRALKRA